MFYFTTHVMHTCQDVWYLRIHVPKHKLMTLCSAKPSQFCVHAAFILPTLCCVCVCVCVCGSAPPSVKQNMIALFFNWDVIGWRLNTSAIRLMPIKTSRKWQKKNNKKVWKYRQAAGCLQAQPLQRTSSVSNRSREVTFLSVYVFFFLGKDCLV